MSWGEIALLGLRTAAKKLFGWLSAGAVGYEVGKHIDNSDGKISYVNTTIIKSNESTDSNSEVKILLAILICLAILTVFAWAIKIFFVANKSQRKQDIEPRACESRPVNRRSSSSV